MFTLDRDLLALEPTLFRDVAWLAQRPLSAQGNVSGTTLTLTTGSLAAALIETGHVAVIDDIPCEITAIASATEATVSLLRASRTDPPIPPPPKTGATVTITTFRPQIALAHDRLMREFGIGDAAYPGGPGESAILNGEALIPLEAAGALALIFASAAALAATGSPLHARAHSWQTRFALARRDARITLDLDGDGRPDSIRTLASWSMARA